MGVTSADIESGRRNGDEMCAIADALMPFLKHKPPSTRKDHAVEAANSVMAAQAICRSKYQPPRDAALDALQELIPAVRAYLMSGDVMTQNLKRQTWGPALDRARYAVEAWRNQTILPQTEKGS